MLFIHLLFFLLRSLLFFPYFSFFSPPCLYFRRSFADLAALEQAEAAGVGEDDTGRGKRVKADSAASAAATTAAAAGTGDDNDDDNVEVGDEDEEEDNDYTAGFFEDDDDIGYDDERDRDDGACLFKVVFVWRLLGCSL